MAVLKEELEAVISEVVNKLKLLYVAHRNIKCFSPLWKNLLFLKN